MAPMSKESSQSNLQVSFCPSRGTRWKELRPVMIPPLSKESSHSHLDAPDRNPPNHDSRHVRSALPLAGPQGPALPVACPHHPAYTTEGAWEHSAVRQRLRRAQRRCCSASVFPIRMGRGDTALLSSRGSQGDAAEPEGCVETSRMPLQGGTSPGRAHILPPDEGDRDRAWPDQDRLLWKAHRGSPAP